jgi:hypothetical protein
MDSTTFYVNAPLSKPEHDALARMARNEGRSKGQQLRLICAEALGLTPSIRITSIKKGGVKRK